MARKPEPPKVHPSLAIDEIGRFYRDAVTVLMTAAYHATQFMDDAEEGKSDPAAVIKAVNPILKEALAKCRAWTELN